MPALEAINYYGAALQVSGRASNVTASNIANADTPGYKARGLDFNAALEARLNGQQPTQTQYQRGLPMGLDDNNVSLDHESVKSAEQASRTREAMTFLDNSTSSLITALRPESGAGQG